MTREIDSSSIPTVLADCRGSSCCVSSQAQRASQRVQPFSCRGSCKESLEHLRGILESTPGVTLVVATDSYLRAKCTTRFLRFVDDLELLTDPDNEVIHVRSASRVGTWDFGVNRRRVESLRRRLVRAQR